MISHFGINFRNSKYGFKICREKYAIINNKNSFKSGEIYSDEWCDKHLNKCLRNYDLNMNYFLTLNKTEFNNELNRFVKENQFIETFDLNEYSEIPGYYILVLDEFCQVYIGTTKHIKERIAEHWTKTKQFDKLIFGGVNSSIISIDSFRVLDTTRIFVKKSIDTFSDENKFINNFLSKFLLNRTSGGLLDDGLIDAIANRKTRNFAETDFYNTNSIMDDTFIGLSDKTACESDSCFSTSEDINTKEYLPSNNRVVNEKQKKVINVNLVKNEIDDSFFDKILHTLKSIFFYEIRWGQFLTYALFTTIVVIIIIILRALP